MKLIIRFFAAVLTLALSLSVSGGNGLKAIPHQYGPEAALQAAKEFTTPDGLQVSLFASEPTMRNPTDMDIDERGRVWIAEGVNYRSTTKPWGILSPKGDRIVILEDTNGSGMANKETVFYQGPDINTALGVCVLGNKVIVSRSPYIYLFTDTNGDGIADTKEVLFSGISGEDHDHGVHSAMFGPDGKLYFNFGNYGHQIKDKNGKPIIDTDGNEVNAEGHPYREGMALRCDMDGSHVEVLGWNFRNPYEVCADSFGTCWQSDNDDDGNRSTRINYVMQHGNFGFVDEMTGASWPEKRVNLEDTIPRRHWHQNDPGVIPNFTITGAGAPTGIVAYEGNLLSAYQDQIILADAGSRTIRAYPTIPDGAGYKTEGTTLMTTADTWFRPSDLCVAPDGSIYVADWNDAGVGGHNMSDHDPDTMTGRVYRLAPTGSKATVPRIDLSTAAGCVAALESPNLSTRYLAWTKLNAMQKDARRALMKLWYSDADPRWRARALWLLALEKGNTNKAITMALKQQNPDLHITGLRVAEEFTPDTTPYVKKLVNDPSPQVRRECAIALRHSSSPDAPKLWAKLAAQNRGDDRWYVEALGIGAHKQEDKYFNAWLALAGDKWNTPGGRDIVWRIRATNAPALLAKIILADETPANERDRYFRSLDFYEAAAVYDAASEVFLGAMKKPTGENRNDIVFKALARLKGIDLQSHPVVKSTMEKVLQSTRGTPEFVNIVKDFGITNQNASLMEVVQKYPNADSTPDAMRLVIADGGMPLIEDALKDTNNSVHLVELLGNSHDKSVVPILLSIMMDTNRDSLTRRQAARSLSQSRDGALKMIELSKDEKLPLEVKFVATVEMNRVPWPDLHDDVVKYYPVKQARYGDALPPMRFLLKMDGDASRGAKVFTRSEVGCVVCHRVNGNGGEVGPDLSEIGTKLGKDALYEAILEPSAGIEFGYEQWHIALKNGDDLYGIIKSETADELTLKDAKAAATHIKKSDIASRQQLKISLMPEGLQQAMSVQDLVDLVDYLSSLKKAAQ